MFTDLKPSFYIMWMVDGFTIYLNVFIVPYNTLRNWRFCRKFRSEVCPSPMKFFIKYRINIVFFDIIIRKIPPNSLSKCLTQAFHGDEPSAKSLPSQANLSDLTEVSKSVKFKPPYFRSFITAIRAILSGPFHRKL